MAGRRAALLHRPQERKARNLEGNAHVVLTSTDRNALHEGLDLVVEGDALRIPMTPACALAAGGFIRA